MIHFETHQRAKMKELAMQRTRQLQEEEEERTRKQKAKARAKLEELNKRSQAGDGSTQKEYITNPQLQEEEEEWTRKEKPKALAKLDELNKQSQAGDGSTQKEYITNPSIQNKPEELQPSETKTAAVKFAAVNSTLNGNAVCQIHDPSISRVEKSSVLPGEPSVETLKISGKEPIVKHNQVVVLHQDINTADDTNLLHAHNNVASKQKRMSYKQKQNIPSEKASSDKVVSTTSTAPKVENEARLDVSLPSGGVTNEVGSACVSDLPISSAAVVDSSANLKKKNIRNSKNKHKHEEISTQAVLPIPKETNVFKSSVESDKSKASDFALDQGVLQPAPLSKDPSQFPEQHRYSANEESHGRTNSQWKSQHSRRLPRNMQANRPAEKSHGTDAVMWAPVKPQNKSEIMDELVENRKTEAVNPVKNEQQVHNLKNKRAEMERYIPKPVAKEMAQQGNILQVASSSSQGLTDDSIGRVDSGSQGPQVIQHTNPVVGKVGSGMESKIRDGRHTKQGKAHGSWRQRNLNESTNVHDELDHDSNSEPSVQKPTEHHQEHKSEVSFVKGGQTKHFSDSGEIDGSNNSNCNDSAAWASAPVKDHAATGRGRRAPFRGHKGAGGNREVDNKRNSWETEKVETLISSSEHGQPDVGMASKENRGVGERLMSQWQPKSQASNNHRWNISSDQNVSSVVGSNKKDPTHDGESLPVSRGKSSNAHVSQSFHDQPVSEKSKAGEAHHLGNQEGKRERRNAPTKRHHYSPNLASEQAPTSADLLQDQRPSSGSGKNVNQNRFRRGHESHGNLKQTTQDNRHYNQPANRERQGPSTHHEYHPLGPYDDDKSDNFERPKNGNHGERRFRERGPTHSRRGGGNSYGRQGGFESYD